MGFSLFARSDKGTPQGGPLSPLLANIYLNELDKELTRRGHHFVRYADDCNIYVKSQRAGERVMRSITHFLEKKLKVKVNPDKTKVGSPFKIEVSWIFTRCRPERCLCPAGQSIATTSKTSIEVVNQTQSRSFPD